MKKITLNSLPLAALSLLIFSCTTTTAVEKVQQPEVQKTQEAIKKENAGDNTAKISAEEENKLRTFLYSEKDTYGWETKSDAISFDFFEDGRLYIQGPDGEATMWEGTWKLSGNQLTMFRADLNKTVTVTAKIDGANLILDKTVYTRYRV